MYVEITNEKIHYFIDASNYSPIRLTHLRKSGSSSSPYLFLYSDMTWCDQMAGRGTSPSNLQSIVRPMFLVSHLQMVT